MQKSDYVQQALRTESNDWQGIMQRLSVSEPTARLLHACLGLASETGEIAEAIFPEAASPLDRVNVLEELGDVLWYAAIACDAVELDLAKLADFGDCYGVIFDPPLGLVTGLGLLAMRGGAVADILKKHVFYGQPLDAAALEDALARVLWVIGFCAAHLEKSIDEVAAANIAKLRARYPERFTAEAAATRDLSAERAALEAQPDNHEGTKAQSDLYHGKDFTRLFDEAILEPAFETNRLRVFQLQIVPMDQNEPHTVFLATRTDEDRPMLTATAVVMPPVDITARSDESSRRTVAWVDWVEVSSEYRRQGFGRELILGIEQHTGWNLCLEAGSELGELFCAAMENIAAGAVEEAPAQAPGAEGAR